MSRTDSKRGPRDSARSGRERPLVLVRETLFSARVESEEGREADFAHHELMALLEEHAPRIRHRDHLRETEPALDRALRAVWSRIPSWLVLTSCPEVTTPTLAVSGMEQEPNFKAALTLSNIVRNLLLARSRREGGTRLAPDTRSDAPTVLFDSKTGFPTANRAARDLLGSTPRSLHQFVGEGNFLKIEQLRTILSAGHGVTIKFLWRAGPGKRMDLEAFVKMSEGLLSTSLKRLDNPIQKPATRALKKPPPPANKREVVFWIECDGVDPIPLGPTFEVSIGRSEAADLILPDPAVSRNHACFKVRGKTVTLEDLGSSNGLVINGRHCTQKRISAGDIIEVGPYTLTIRGPDAEAADKTSILDRDDLPTGTVSHTGNLRDTPLATLLLELEEKAQTGTLIVSGPRVEGRIVLRGGRVHSAGIADRSDREALDGLLTLQQGDYAFIVDNVNGAGLDMTVETLLRSVGRDILGDSRLLLPGDTTPPPRA